MDAQQARGICLLLGFVGVLMMIVLVVALVQSLLSRLGSPCLFGHQDPRLFERGSDGALLLVCPRCRAAHRVRLVTP